MVELKNALKTAKRLGNKGRNKVFCGLSARFNGGAWAAQNKKCLNDWMAYCNVSRPEDIDYNQPNVAIENKLNSPFYRKIVCYGSEAERMAFWELLETPEQRKLYFEGDGTGAYCDMEPDRGRAARQWYHKHFID